MLRGPYLRSAGLPGQRAGLLLLPVRLLKSFRHGAGRRIAPAAPLCFPSRPRGPGGHGSRTRVSPRPPSVSTGPGRAGLPLGATTRAARRGGEGRRETRPEPAANSAPARPSGGSALARRAPRGGEGPGRSGTAPPPACPPLPARQRSARGPEHFPSPRGNSRGRRRAPNAGAHLAPRRSLARSLPRRERRVRLPAPSPPPRGSRGPARSAPAAPPHVRAWLGSAAAAPAGPGRGRCSAPAEAAPRRQREPPTARPAPPPGSIMGQVLQHRPAGRAGGGHVIRRPRPGRAPMSWGAGPGRGGAAGGGALWWRRGGRPRPRHGCAVGDVLFLRRRAPRVPNLFLFNLFCQ